VLDALLREAEAAGATLSAAQRVQTVTRTAESLSLATARGTIHARFVVLATGGLSLPKTGSDGGGLEMARSLGHTIVPTTPALVPLTLGPDEPLHAQLRGVAQDVELSLWVDDALRRRFRGALLWTHFGVSGPVVLDASRHWLRAQLEGRPARVTISFTPGEQFETLDARWTSIASTRPRTSVSTALSAFLPGSAARALLDLLRLDGALPLADFPRADRRRLTHALVATPLPVTGSRGYSYAEATAGGVALDEVDPSTMASRRAAGVYLVGEILDVDGRLGGFNFQWAWASARVAAAALAAGA
jgi:predicted Rossmann fold flavoprotein